MKKTLTSLLAVCVVLLGFSPFVFADKKPKPHLKTELRKAQTSDSHELLYALPASDAVVSLNAKKFFDEAMPQILAANAPRMVQINEMLDDIKGKIGIDLRSFEKLAVGINIIRPKKSNALDFAPVLLARGRDVNAGAYLAAARLATNGKFREEKYAGRTIYIFSVKDLTDNLPNDRTSVKKGDKTKNPTEDGDSSASIATQAIDISTSLIGSEIALTNLDENTLSLGEPARVKESLNAVTGKIRINSEILQAATKSPSAIMSFAGNMPAEMSQIIGIDDPSLGELIKTVDTVRQMSGFMEMSEDGNATLSMSAKTARLEQAEQLEETLNFLKSFGANILGSKKTEMNKIYARTLQNAKVSRLNSEVELKINILAEDVRKMGSKL